MRRLNVVPVAMSFDGRRDEKLENKADREA